MKILVLVIWILEAAGVALVAVGAAAVATAMNQIGRIDGNER